MATTPLTEAIATTSAETARSTTAVLRQATFVRVNGSMGIVDLAGGEVEATLNGLVPSPGETVMLLQQGYDLMLVGPMSVEVAVSTTEPTSPGLKLWMKV